MAGYLLQRLETFGSELAIAAEGLEIGYARLLELVRRWRARFVERGVAPGQVLSVEGEYGAESIAALLALLDLRCIAVPLSRDSRAHHGLFLELSRTEWRISVEEDGALRPTGARADHPLYDVLRRADDPGLVLFTSGSTGANKAAVHNLRLLLEKFREPRQRLRTIVFLQLDHIGGVNTLLYTLSNGGAVVATEDRSPASVCAAIERYRVDLLPTSPTFLNLLLLSREYQKRDLSSLRLITYGTEPMPASTLARVHEAFPGAKLQQTYGTTELGILRSKSRDSGSLWVRVGGDGYETKVVNGRLWVRAASAMLGYLNAPSPFDDEGYFDTQDRVEVDGEWMRILGRESDVINVGGSKVHPAEVESVLLEMEGLVDAAVRGERHPLTGQIVTATVRLASTESPSEFRIRMRRHCQGRLPEYAVPAKVRISQEALHSERYKRMR